MKVLYLFFLLLVSLFTAYGQRPLDEYIKMGLENNLTLQQNNLSLQKAEFALKIASGMFLPEASLQSRYTLASGGRTIDFPIGDLLNPVYSTLNQMLQQQGQSGNFPVLENEQINFLRPQEYDAAISVVQPVFSKQLQLNRQIAKQQCSMNQAEMELFKNKLVLNIKEAYYNYLKTVQLEEMVNRTIEMVNENYRVTQKLFENNMITRDAVLRAKSDISKVKLFETSVLKNREMARSYFNFLINRDLQAEILSEDEDDVKYETSLDQLTQTALDLREELKQIDLQTNLYDNVAKLNRAENIPVLALAVTAGLQGDNSTEFKDADYVMGSVVLNWKLFNGNINSNKRQQALIEKHKSEIQKQEVANQIMLEVKQKFLDVEEQKQNLVLANDRFTEAKEAYRIMDKRFRQGEAPLIELMDARNTLVESESDYISTKYNLLISIARLQQSSHTALIP